MFSSGHYFCANGRGAHFCVRVNEYSVMYMCSQNVGYMKRELNDDIHSDLKLILRLAGDLGCPK